MARIIDNTQYKASKEVLLETVKEGHTVLIRHPDGEIRPYVVCRLGNTPIVFSAPISTTPKMVVMNQENGRIVLKHPRQRCVVVSCVITVRDFHGKRAHALTGNVVDTTYLGESNE